MDKYKNAKDAMRSIGYSLASIADYEGIDALHVSTFTTEDCRYVSGFAVGDDVLLFDFTDRGWTDELGYERDA